MANYGDRIEPKMAYHTTALKAFNAGKIGQRFLRNIITQRNQGLTYVISDQRYGMVWYS